MRNALALAFISGASVLALTLVPVARATVSLAVAAQQKSALTPPESIRTEHEHIHKSLEALTQTPGEVGVAAKALAATLHPHFVREEEIALPPLGLLAPLASGKLPAEAEEALRMSETLRKEMPRMLDEHKAIRGAVDNLLKAARQARNPTAEEFGETLALHARTEEEVLYPAAMLVGDIIRGRTPRR